MPSVLLLWCSPFKKLCPITYSYKSLKLPVLKACLIPSSLFLLLRKSSISFKVVKIYSLSTGGKGYTVLLSLLLNLPVSLSYLPKFCSPWNTQYFSHIS